MVSYPILSKQFYEGDPVSSKTVKIAPKDIKSMQSVPITVGSYGHAVSNPIGVVYDGKINWINRTSGNTFVTTDEDYKKNGYFSPQPDDGIKRDGYQFSTFGDWVNAAVNVKPIDFNPIPRISDIAGMRGIAYITGAPLPSFSHPSDTSIPSRVSSTEVMAVDNNAVGLYGSRVQTNLEQPIRSMIEGGKYHSEGKEYFEFIGERRWTFDKAKTAGVRGLGILNDVEGEGFLWAYFPGLGYLVAEGEVHKKIERQAKDLGLTDGEAREAIEIFKAADIGLHEGGHIDGIKGNRSHERLQGLYRAEFFSRLAERFKGTKRGRIYEALAKEGEAYAREHSFWQSIWGEITADVSQERKGPIDILVAKFSKEADEFELTGDFKTMYINSRLQETYGRLLSGTPSYNEGKKHSSKSENKKSSNNKKGLESLVKDEKSEPQDSKGRTEKTYESIDSEHRSMSDVEATKEGEAKPEEAGNVEASEAPAE